MGLGRLGKHAARCQNRTVGEFGSQQGALLLIFFVCLQNIRRTSDNTPGEEEKGEDIDQEHKQLWGAFVQLVGLGTEARRCGEGLTFQRYSF
jgi:hypothetical protein